MIESDRKTLYGALAGVFELYGKRASPELFEIYFGALQAFEIQDILRALNLHAVDPDQGQFCPKPADVVRHISGSKQTRALQAWTKVERALRSVGPYQSVAFDDPIIHAVIEEMGGWIDLCNTPTEKDLVFKSLEFGRRYQGYVLQGGVLTYPARLTGLAEASRSNLGMEAPAPTLVGDQGQALEVLKLGGESGQRVAITKAADVAGHLRLGHQQDEEAAA